MTGERRHAAPSSLGVENEARFRGETRLSEGVGLADSHAGSPKLPLARKPRVSGDLVTSRALDPRALSARLEGDELAEDGGRTWFSQGRAREVKRSHGRAHRRTHLTGNPSWHEEGARRSSRSDSQTVRSARGAGGHGLVGLRPAARPRQQSVGAWRLSGSWVRAGCCGDSWPWRSQGITPPRHHSTPHRALRSCRLGLGTCPCVLGLGAWVNGRWSAASMRTPRLESSSVRGGSPGTALMNACTAPGSEGRAQWSRESLRLANLLRDS